ncbi:hypothetical protein ABPG74_005498 [Tetrahymena malaccensis]
MRLYFQLEIDFYDVTMNEQKSSIIDQQQVQKENTQTETDKIQDECENEFVENNLPIAVPNFDICYSDSSKQCNMFKLRPNQSQINSSEFQFKKNIQITSISSPNTPQLNQQQSFFREKENFVINSATQNDICLKNDFQKDCQEKVVSNSKNFNQSSFKFSQNQIISASKKDVLQLNRQSQLNSKQDVYDLKQKKDSEVIQQTNFKEIISQSIPNKIREIIKGVNCLSRGQIFKQKYIDAEVKKEIEEQIAKGTDIFQHIKDIIFLKKAIMILLTKEQLAMISLVGFSQNKNSSGFGYFEEQFKIYNSQELQIKLMNQFKLNCQLNKTLSIVDKRIKSSLSVNLDI